MYLLEPDQSTGTISLAATGSTPVELMQEALRGVLAVLRSAAPDLSEPGTAVVPFQGQGAGLGPLFVDLAQDMISQLEEFGTGLDEVRLDGLLRTDTGGFTAWGYLSGDPEREQDAPHPLTITEPVIVADGEELRLTCDLLHEPGAVTGASVPGEPGPAAGEGTPAR
jgi:hypothetical protein